MPVPSHVIIGHVYSSPSQPSTQQLVAAGGDDDGPVVLSVTSRFHDRYAQPRTDGRRDWQSVVE